MKIKQILKTLLISGLVLINISCDQISKDVVRKKINTHEIINIVSDNFILTKVENTGAALSLGENLAPLLKILLLQILPLLVLLFLYRMIIIKTNLSRIMTIGFCFIIGGGIGNIYDRILYGSVTDFMHINFGIFKTGIFNMADVSIVIGVILIFINMITDHRQRNYLKASL